MRSNSIPFSAARLTKTRGYSFCWTPLPIILPSPIDIDHVVGFNPDEPEKEEERKADDNEPFCGLAFKIVSDPFVGKLAYVRVYSGTLKSGTYVYNASKGKRERIAKVLQMHSAQRVEIPETYAAKSSPLWDSEKPSTGDTLCDEKHPIVLENMVFPDPRHQGGD